MDDESKKTGEDQDSDVSEQDLIEVVDEVDDDGRPVNLNRSHQDQTTEEDSRKAGKKSKKKIKNSESCDNPDTSDDEDKDSPEAVAARLDRGCECSSDCFKGLDPDKVYKHRLNIAELTKNEHDMYLMGVTMACITCSKTTTRQKERQRHRATYIYQGKKVCLEAFSFLENVSLYHIRRIRNHVLVHGVTPRIHGNLGKKAHNAFSLDVYRNVENYVKKYLKPYVTDFNKNQVIYGINRADVYYSYRDHGRKPDEKLMGYSTFRHFMKKQFPQIKFQRVDYSGKHSTEPSTHKIKRGKSAKENVNDIKMAMAGNVSFNVNVSSGIVINEDEQNANQKQQTAYFVAPIPMNNSFIKVVSENFPVIGPPNAK